MFDATMPTTLVLTILLYFQVFMTAFSYVFGFENIQIENYLFLCIIYVYYSFRNIWFHLLNKNKSIILLYFLTFKNCSF